MKKIKIDYDNALFADIDDLKLIDIQEKINGMESNSKPSGLPVALVQKYEKSLEKYDYFMNMFFNGHDVALKDVPKILDTSHCTKGGSNFKFLLKVLLLNQVLGKTCCFYSYALT